MLIHIYFSIFPPKYMLWVLIRSTSATLLMSTHKVQQSFAEKSGHMYKTLHVQVKCTLMISWWQYFNMILLEVSFNATSTWLSHMDKVTSAEKSQQAADVACKCFPCHWISWCYIGLYLHNYHWRTWEIYHWNITNYSFTLSPLVATFVVCW